MKQSVPFLVVLLATTSAQANDWEWKRLPISPEEYCDNRRVEKLTPLSKCELNSVVEAERAAFNDRTLLQYNRVLPIPLPSMPTPDVGPPSRRGLHRFFH